MTGERPPINPENGSSFIRITNRDIWEKLVELEKEVDELTTDIKLQVGSNLDMQKRVRSLELRFYGVLAGLIGAIGTFTAILIQGGGA